MYGVRAKVNLDPRNLVAATLRPIREISETKVRGALRVENIVDCDGYADQIVLGPSPEFRRGGPVGCHRRRSACR